MSVYFKKKQIVHYNEEPRKSFVVGTYLLKKNLFFSYDDFTLAALNRDFLDMRDCGGAKCGKKGRTAAQDTKSKRLRGAKKKKTVNMYER